MLVPFFGTTVWKPATVVRVGLAVSGAMKMPPALGASSLSRPVKTILPPAALGGEVEPKTPLPAVTRHRDCTAGNGIAAFGDLDHRAVGDHVAEVDTGAGALPFESVQLPLKVTMLPVGEGAPGNWSNLVGTGWFGTRNCGKTLGMMLRMPVMRGPPPGVAYRPDVPLRVSVPSGSVVTADGVNCPRKARLPELASIRGKDGNSLNVAARDW